MKKFLFVFIILIMSPISVLAYTEAPVDIIDMGIEDIQKAIDDGLLNYETLVKLYLDRIEAYDDDYNSIIRINENAIKEARALDKEYKETGRRSIIHGIPVVVKDNIDVKGMPTTAGAKALDDNFPKTSSKVVSTLTDKGAIIIAKSNMSEFAFSANSSFSSYGKTRNAYNNSYTSYGSSGGTAVSVALQFATVGLGTDTNSSIRLPAAAASLVGMRASHNLVSLDGILPYDINRDVVGPLTRTVRDNAIMLDLMQGNDGYTYLNKIDDEFDLKLGIVDNSITSSTYSEVKRLFKEKTSLIENSEIKTDHIDYFGSKTREFYNKTIGGWTWCQTFNKYMKNTTSKIRTLSDLSRSSGKIYYIGNYVGDCNRSGLSTFETKVKNNRSSYLAYFKDILKKNDIDIIVYVTTQNKISKIESPYSNGWSDYTAPPSGLPAITIPMGYDKDGLPYGIEIFGLDEQTLYETALKIESLKYEYKLPSKAKSLYEIPQTTTKLIEILKEDVNKKDYTPKTYEEYSIAFNNIKAYLENYDNVDKRGEKETDLLNAYNTAKENLILKSDVFNYKYLLAGLIGLMIILVLIISKKKRKKRRRR